MTYLPLFHQKTTTEPSGEGVTLWIQGSCHSNLENVRMSSVGQTAINSTGVRKSCQAGGHPKKTTRLAAAPLVLHMYPSQGRASRLAAAAGRRGSVGPRGPRQPPPAGRETYFLSSESRKCTEVHGAALFKRPVCPKQISASFDWR